MVKYLSGFINWPKAIVFNISCYLYSDEWKVE
jgi:hypothetical protein